MELKERILETSLSAFMQCGIKSVTMDEIASRMGISKRTIYENFKDKEEILIEAIRHRENQSREFMKKLLSEGNNVLEMVLLAHKKKMDDIVHINERFFEDIKKYYHNVRAMTEEIKENDYKDSIVFFELGQKQGVFRKDINYDIMEVLVREQGAILFNTRHLFKKYSHREVFENVIFMFMRGISTLKGHQIIDEFIESYKTEPNKETQK